MVGTKFQVEGSDNLHMFDNKANNVRCLSYNYVFANNVKYGIFCPFENQISAPAVTINGFNFPY